jgi:ATP-dependent DNA helicase DinG
MAFAVNALLNEDGAIARRISGFESRPQQLEMAAAVADCLARKGRLLVEAGTGVGTTFAYLLPAIARVVEQRERVVICTHTIALQEQIVDSDIPLLNAAIPEEFTSVLVKGRGNYVSLRRLGLASGRQDRLFGHETDRHELHQIEDWAYSTRDGTLASLPVVPKHSVWEHVQSDAGNCMGRRCPTYDRCFYQAARRRMEHSDILVCNHALFFSDLALRARGRGFLPAYQHVILDEAHCIESVAAEHFGARISESRVGHLLRALWNPAQGRGFLAALRVREGADRTVADAVAACEAVRRASEEFFAALWRLGEGAAADGSRRIAGAGAVPDPLSGALRQLAGLLRLVRERTEDEADSFELNAFAQRAQDMSESCEALVSQSLPGCVYWTEAAASRRRQRGGGRPEMSLLSAAVDVSPILRQHLFAQDVSVVLTSATLATARGRDGDDERAFAHAALTLGATDARTMSLGSPFDYARQVRVIVEAAMPDPRAPGHADALAERIMHHVEATDGGAFVLFTSFATMNAVASRITEPLVEAGHPVHVQGMGAPNAVLLRRFREDERSVLMGVASFWQGIDVRGRALRNVIITRLPFDPPDDPLVQAREELLKSQGKSAFMHDQLPRAVIRFRQGFGRLIRGATDSGRVVVLDPRIVTKPYGRAFLDALPEGIEPEIRMGEDAE